MKWECQREEKAKSKGASASRPETEQVPQEAAQEEASTAEAEATIHEMTDHDYRLGF